MDAVIRKASGSLLIRFLRLQRANLARGTLSALLQEISLASCAFSFCRLSRLSPIDSRLSTAQNHRWGVVSSTWITAEMIFSSPYISLAPRKPLSTPRFAFLRFLVISPQVVPLLFTILTASFRNCFILYPASKWSSTRSPYVRSSFGFRKILSFVRSGF